jgi:protein-disulfide isomerase
MAGRGGTGRKKQPQRRLRRSPLQRLGAWVPVAVVGAGAIAIVVAVIVVGRVRSESSNTNVGIPERTVSTEGRTLVAEGARVRVTIDEYSDFQCPYCARAAQTMDPNIEQEYVADGRVKLVFHPLALIGQESLWAADAAECANEQGRFWDYHDKLFENQHGENQGAFVIDNLKRFAEELALDTQAFNQCLDSGKYEDIVKAETRDAVNKGILSTPTFVVGSQTVEGPGSYDALKKVIEAELRKNP